MMARKRPQTALSAASDGRKKALRMLILLYCVVEGVTSCCVALVASFATP